MSIDIIAQRIADSICEWLLVLDSDLRVQSVNRAFCETFGTSVGEAENRFFFDLDSDHWNIAGLREALQAMVSTGTPFEEMDIIHTFAAAGYRALVINA